VTPSQLTTPALSLTYHQDPGHGWVEIERDLAQRLLGDDFQRISPYSYQLGQRIFLEEDCDAGLLVDACKRAGITLDLRDAHCNSESFIRNLPSFLG
jgi:hypothetical protein